MYSQYRPFGFGVEAGTQPGYILGRSFNVDFEVSIFAPF